jgi:hypothetical protein
MTHITDGTLPYDSDIFNEINTHIALSKGEYFGTLSCHQNYVKRVGWSNHIIEDQLKIKCIITKIHDVNKFVNNISSLRKDKLYIYYLESDFRYEEAKWEQLREESKSHLMSDLNTLSEEVNIKKLWKSKSKLMFLMSHKVREKALEKRFFKWMKQNSPKHHYKIYGISKPNIDVNPMGFLTK